MKNENIIGFIQGAIKTDKISHLGILTAWTFNDVAAYIKSIPRFSKAKDDDVMKAMQRMVRAKHKGYELIKRMKGFIPNPNPNRRRK